MNLFDEFMRAEMRAALDMFDSLLGDELRTRSEEACRRQLAGPSCTWLIVDTGAITLRVAKRIAEERNLTWPKLEDFQRAGGSRP